MQVQCEHELSHYDHEDVEEDWDVEDDDFDIDGEILCVQAYPKFLLFVS
jgi:hypothetical protein